MMNPEWGRRGRLVWPTRAEFEGWNAGRSGEEARGEEALDAVADEVGPAATIKPTYAAFSAAGLV